MFIGFMLIGLSEMLTEYEVHFFELGVDWFLYLLVCVMFWLSLMIIGLSVMMNDFNVNGLC